MAVTTENRRIITFIYSQIEDLLAGRRQREGEEQEPET
jgi:hypothetical protein